MDYRKESRFIEALRDRSCDVVDSMLADGYIPNPRDISLPCEVGDVDMLLRLLKYPMDLQEGLFYAIYYKQTHIYDHLFVAGVDINLPLHGRLPLCCVKDPVTCKWLLDMGARHIPDENGNTPLCHACCNLNDIDDNDNIEIINMLLANLENNVVECILATDKRGMNALHLACFYKRINTVKLLLDCLETHGYSTVQAVTNATQVVDKQIVRTIHAVEAIHTEADCLNIASARCSDLLEVLLDRLGDQASQIVTARHLHYACSHSNIEAIKLLLQYTNNSDSKDNDTVEIVDNDGNTMLHFAVEDYVFEWLLEKGAKQLPNKEGNTPLHNLCSWEYNHLVTSLAIDYMMKDFGIAEMNATGDQVGVYLSATLGLENKYMANAIFSMLVGDKQDPIGSILGKYNNNSNDKYNDSDDIFNDNPDDEDNSNDIPVVYDQCINNQDRLNVIKLLLQHSPPFERNNKGSTPLHEACLFGNIDVVRLILKYLGDQAEEIINQPNNDGHTPLDLAVHHPKVISLLECYI